MRKKRRFIAGAKCTNCGATDTVVYQQLENIGQVECVKCGHIETETDGKVEQQTRDNEQVIGVFKPE
jgi:uncharacterized metal-binding protein (TIGR02443 family)